jgi:hypothetical protein
MHATCAASDAAGHATRRRDNRFQRAVKFHPLFPRPGGAKTRLSRQQIHHAAGSGKKDWVLESDRRKIRVYRAAGPGVIQGWKEARGNPQRLRRLGCTQLNAA